jgi:hypothetical protein
LQQDNEILCPPCENCLISINKPIAELTFKINMSELYGNENKMIVADSHPLSKTNCEDVFLEWLNYTYEPEHFCRIEWADEQEIGCHCWYRK